MRNFKFSNPTEIFFGKGQIKVLANQIKKHGGSKILLTYGKESIKKIGLYQNVISILKENNFEIFELSNIDPNPRITSVREGGEICKKNNIDFVLAVGAGSVLDCSKAISAAAFYDGDPWDFAIGKAKIKKTIPLGTILTLAATGSEMNGGAVISNMETNEKLPIHADITKPKFSILDPEYTFSVPKTQTAAGIADIASHVFEQYFSLNNDAYITDKVCEGILKTLIKYGPVAINEPENYEARANIMWAGTLALNGLLACGKITDWATHLIEHEVSAYYDLTHGVGLAIITPNWMKHVLDESNFETFCNLGENVFNFNQNPSIQTAELTINKVREFFISLQLPSTFKEVNVDNSKFELMAEHINKVFGEIGGFKKLNKSDIVGILRNSE
ncbi:MAG: iron-containing alcohol dehydrogenase [Candidatus Muiribacteriota bacterium]|jgi:alcohol dehydrogenase YqhD (iron-dependent ADH family)